MWACRMGVALAYPRGLRVIAGTTVILGDVPCRPEGKERKGRKRLEPCSLDAWPILSRPQQLNHVSFSFKSLRRHLSVQALQNQHVSACGSWQVTGCTRKPLHVWIRKKKHRESLSTCLVVHQKLEKRKLVSAEQSLS